MHSRQIICHSSFATDPKNENVVKKVSMLIITQTDAKIRVSRFQFRKIGVFMRKLAVKPSLNATCQSQPSIKTSL